MEISEDRLIPRTNRIEGKEIDPSRLIPRPDAKPIQDQFNELPKEDQQTLTQVTGPRPAGLGTHANAATVDDPQIKMQIYANARFPDDPKAIERYGIQDGQVVFLGDDGRIHKETGDLITDKLTAVAGEEIANAPSTLLSTAGAGLGGAIGAGAGSFIGELIKQEYAKRKHGEEMPMLERGVKAGIMGGLGTASELGGRATNEMVNAVLGKVTRGGKVARVASQDLHRLDKPEMIRMQELYKEKGITPTLGETTDLGSLQKEYIVNKGMPSEGGDLLQKFERDVRVPEQDAAIQKELRKISPETSIARAEKKGEKAIKEIADDIKKRRDEQANRLYAKSFQEETNKPELLRMKKRNTERIKQLENVEADFDTSQMAKELQESGVPSMQQMGEGKDVYTERIARDYAKKFKKTPLMKEVKTDNKRIADLKKENQNIDNVLSGKDVKGFKPPKMKRKVDTTDVMNEVDSVLAKSTKGDPSFAAFRRVKNMIKEADGDLEKLHEIKQSGIDNVLDKMKVPKIKRRMQIVKNKLLSSLQKTSPQYDVARQAYEQQSKTFDKFVESMLGTLKKGKFGWEVKDPKKLVGKSASPEAIAQARAYFMPKHKEAWDAISSAYLRDSLENITVVPIAQGAKFQKLTHQSVRQKRRLQSALQEKYQSYADLMEVLEKTNVIIDRNSNTAAKQEAIKQSKNNIGGYRGLMLKVARYYKSISPSGAEEMIKESAHPKHVLEVSKKLITPQGQQQIKRLKQLKPGTKDQIRLLLTFAGVAGGTQAGRLVQKKTTEDVEPKLPSRLVTPQQWQQLLQQE
jgi:hypothetical protein